MKYAIFGLTAAALVGGFGSDSALCQGAGFVTLSARLGPTGVVAFGSGVQSAARVSAGVYVVTFTRSVTGCNFLATLQSNTPGQIVAAPIVGQPTQVRVRAFNKAGTPTDTGVSLMVNCAS